MRLLFTIIIKKPAFQSHFTACAGGGDRAPCLGVFQAEWGGSSGGSLFLPQNPQPALGTHSQPWAHRAAQAPQELPIIPDSHPLSPSLASPQLHPPGVSQTKPNSQPSDPGGSSDARPNWTPQWSPLPLVLWQNPPHGTDPLQSQAALQRQP